MSLYPAEDGDRMSAISNSSKGHNPSGRMNLDGNPPGTGSIVSRTKRDRTPRSSVVSMASQMSDRRSISREMTECLNGHLQMHIRQKSEMGDRQKIIGSTANTMVASSSQPIGEIAESRHHREAIAQ